MSFRHQAETYTTAGLCESPDMSACQGHPFCNGFIFCLLTVQPHTGSGFISTPYGALFNAAVRAKSVQNILIL